MSLCFTSRNHSSDDFRIQNETAVNNTRAGRIRFTTGDRNRVRLSRGVSVLLTRNLTTYDARKCSPI